MRTLDEKGQHLAEAICKDREASLARVASAFSGPGQALDLQNIEHVQVMCVDDHHIEIEAVVCETDSCVTLAVPVDFPKSCTEEDLEDCILENLGLLDYQAGDRLREREWEKEHGEEDERIWQTLRSTGDMDLPLWWDFCPELKGECDAVAILLNEKGFQAEIRALAIKTLLDNGEYDIDVEKAVVAAVCPAGVHLRAHARRLQKDEYEVVDVPIAFSQSAQNAETLRSAVLNAVMSASSYV